MRRLALLYALGPLSLLQGCMLMPVTPYEDVLSSTDGFNDVQLNQLLEERATVRQFEELIGPPWSINEDPHWRIYRLCKDGGKKLFFTLPVPVVFADTVGYVQMIGAYFDEEDRILKIITETREEVPANCEGGDSHRKEAQIWMKKNLP